MQSRNGVVQGGSGSSNASRPIPKVSYLPQLDGLRAIAILLVLWVHFPFIEGSDVSRAVSKLGLAMRAGYFGVDLFFVLSGFLITRILLNERAHTGGVSLRSFYIRRALRIFPIYYLCVLIYALLFAGRQGDIVALLTYTFNYYRPFHGEPMALEQAWSLSVEEQFYLFWPFVVAALPLAWGRKTTALLIPAVCFACALLLAASFEGELAMKTIYMFGPTRMMSLSLGAYLAFREHEGDLPKWSESATWIGVGAAIMGLDSAARAAGLISSAGLYWSAALVGSASATFGIVSLLLFAGRLPALLGLRSFLSLPLLRRVGGVSYGLYLYHNLVLFFLGVHVSQTAEGGAPASLVALALCLTFLVAFLSYYCLERPLLDIKDRLSSVAYDRRAPRLEPSPALSQNLSTR